MHTTPQLLPLTISVLICASCGARSVTTPLELSYIQRDDSRLDQLRELRHNSAEKYPNTKITGKLHARPAFSALNDLRTGHKVTIVSCKPFRDPSLNYSVRVRIIIAGKTFEYPEVIPGKEFHWFLDNGAFAISENRLYRAPTTPPHHESLLQKWR